MIIYIIIAAIHMILFVSVCLIDVDLGETREICSSIWWGWPLMILAMLITSILWPIYMGYFIYDCIKAKKAP